MRLKKIIAVIISVCICASLVAPVNAAMLSTQDKANVLSDLSIFKSSNLNAQVKRFEAAIYIVRLLGKEESVKADAETYMYTGFDDVDSSKSYAPYVGYCDGQGLITDDKNNKFLPEQYISEKSFLSFVLGALGYVYNKDFNMGNIYKKAYDTGLVTDTVYKTKTADNTKYKKTDVVNVLYNSLSKEIKGSKVKLIQNLVNEKVITKEQALATGILTDKIITAIDQITVFDQNKIMVKINEQVKTILPENIKIYETKNPYKALEFTIQSQTGQGVLMLGTGAQTPYESYTVELANIVDEEGNASPVLSKTFEGFRSSEVKSDFFKISRVEPISKNSINIYFTHPVNINAEIASNYEIMEGDSVFVKGSPQTAGVKVLSTVNNGVTLFLKDRTFTKDATYLLRAGGGLISAYGVNLNDGSGDSIRFKGVDNESTSGTAAELKVLSMGLLDNKTMQIEFNMELNQVLAKQIFNYYITDNYGNPVQVKKAVVAGDGAKSGKIVLVSINSAFDKTRNYELTINYLTDASRQFTIVEKKYQISGVYPDKTELAVTGVNTIDERTVAVSFNKPLDVNLAQNIAYYSIAGITHTGYYSMPVKAYYNPEKDAYTVKLYLPANNPVQAGKFYEMRVLTTLQDYLGNPLTQNPKYLFKSADTLVVKPAIRDAVIIGKDSIKLTFNKEVAFEAPNVLTGNYMLQYYDGGTLITKAPVSMCIADETTFILKFDSLDFKTQYTLRINNIKDCGGFDMRTASDAQSSVNVVMGK